jgi:hypothetical protein
MSYYDPATGGPFQLHSQQQPQQYDYSAPGPVAVATVPPPTSQRASSGAWTPQDDQALIDARASGLNWGQIQNKHFPGKTPNACRKRHERLMDRKNADQWGQRKLEILAREYMNRRKEIWAPLATATGEKWSVVEQKVCLPEPLSVLVLPYRNPSLLMANQPLLLSVHVEWPQESSKRSSGRITTGTSRVWPDNRV